MIKRTWTRALGLILVCFGAQAAEPPSAADFARRPEIREVQTSPSGQRLALLVGGADGRMRLATMTLDPIGKPRVVAGFNDADISDIRWVNEDRLIFTATQREVAEVSEGRGGSFAVDFDGGQQRQLTSWAWVAPRGGERISLRILPWGWFVHSTLRDGSDDILMVQRRRDELGDITGVVPARMNTRTGVLQNMAQGMPESTWAFWTDRKDQLRALVASEGTRNALYWRKTADAPWARLTDFDRHDSKGFTPWAIQDDDSLLVQSGHQGYSALFRYDPRTQKMDDEPVVAVAGYDLWPEREFDPATDRLLGLHFRAAGPVSYWLDDDLDRVQRGVDKALPGRVNRLHCGRCSQARFFVVHSYSDRHPGEFWLFDKQKGQLSPIGVARPWLDPERQGRRTAHRVKARDGLEFPLYVTHPAGAKDDEPLPTVVLVHGGPWVRGADTSWDEEAQFLASRGYRVLEPEFRGSEGYGWALFRAGWKAWGGAMQDDLVDAIGWAADRKWVDRSKVCIVGASYGGYAALMAPIVHPDAFRCAVAFAAVTDPVLMYDISWSDISEDARRFSMPTLMGDRVKDAALLERSSPLKRVAELRIPVLLLHGELDRRVPVAHADRFVDAARAAKVPVEKVIYADEGHGLFKTEDRVDYYQRMERFLAASLKASPARAP